MTPDIRDRSDRFTLPMPAQERFDMGVFRYPVGSILRRFDNELFRSGSVSPLRRFGVAAFRAVSTPYRSRKTARRQADTIFGDLVNKRLHARR